MRTGSIHSHQRLPPARGQSRERAPVCGLQDYRNHEYDIQLTESTDGGATWSPSKTVNPDTALDHYMPAVDVVQTSGQDHVAVSYYRSQRIPNENSGATFAPGQSGVQAEPSDYVLAGGENVTVPFHFTVV